MSKADFDKPAGMLGQGEETVKVGEKEYRARWQEGKGHNEAGEVFTKVWSCSDVPGGLVKSITRIPVLRQKLSRVLEAADLADDSHDGKELIEILEGYPREELFEISAEQLTPIALGVLRLGERKQVRLFLRPDAYGRYMSCLTYLPRDR